MNTILFDLDGTLLPMDLNVFMKAYMKKICFKLKHILEPDKAYKYIWDATFEMVKNLDDTKTNQEVFMNKFCEIASVDNGYIYDVFLDFYNNEYKELQEMFDPSEEMVESVKILKQKGYDLVVATNPLFPMQAIEERIKWANLDVNEFTLVTSFEDMHFCKPQIQYFQEILEKIGKKPEECLMVGNDTEEDLVAKKVGIRTYLIENYVINKSGSEIQTDYKGSYKEFLEFVKCLPEVNLS